MHQLAAFYQGPLGQKLLAESPGIAKESMAIGAAWGERSGREAMERALARVRNPETRREIRRRRFSRPPIATRDAQVALKAMTGKDPHMVWHQESELPDVDLVVLPGGFSYGDYLRCGAMASSRR